MFSILINRKGRKTSSFFVLFRGLICQRSFLSFVGNNTGYFADSRIVIYISKQQLPKRSTFLKVVNDNSGASRVVGLSSQYFTSTMRLRHRGNECTYCGPACFVLCLILCGVLPLNVNNNRKHLKNVLKNSLKGIILLEK